MLFTYFTYHIVEISTTHICTCSKESSSSLTLPSFHFIILAFLFYEEYVLPNGLERLRSQDLCLGRNAPLEKRNAMWSELATLARHQLLETVARNHTCEVCIAMPTLGFDVKVGATVPVCACKDGNLHKFVETGLSRSFGCKSIRTKGSRFCSLHAQQTADTAPLVVR